MAARQQGRSAKTGRWVPVAQARKKPNTHVVEKVNHPKKKS